MLTNKQRLKVVMVENNLTFRDSLRAWLERIEDCDVVGTAADMSTALNLVLTLNPDLVTMDGQLDNEESGLRIAAAIRAENPNVKILMISGDGLQFEGAGLKKTGSEEFLNALKVYLAKLRG